MQVPGMPGKDVTFRGIKNLDGVIDFLMSHGGDKATEFVVTGNRRPPALLPQCNIRVENQKPRTSLMC